MGAMQGVICAQCGHRHEILIGPGMTFLLLHCEVCGRPKSVARSDVQAAPDTASGEEPGLVMCLESNSQRIAAIAGRCDCGGSFSLDAPPRCPRCRSTEYRSDPDGMELLYD